MQRSFPIPSHHIAIFRLTGALALSLWLFCSLNEPAQNEHYEISLSVVDKGTHYGVFSGDPIRAIIELPDTQKVSDLDFHTWALATSQRHPDARVTQIEFQLQWQQLPPFMDTIRGVYTRYDSVWVTCNGVQSNPVIVSVVNIAPKITSLRIADSLFTTQQYDTVSYILDTIPSSLQVTITAADQENPSALKYAFYHNDRERAGSSASYTITRNSIVMPDTLWCFVNDNDGGKDHKVILFTSGVPNKSPYLTSLTAGDTSWSDFAELKVYRDTALDTLTLRLSANDSDATASQLRYHWNTTGHYGSIYSATSDTGALVSYICTSSVCTVSDRGLDTVSVWVSDRSGDTSSHARIAIGYGMVIRTPVVDSMRIADSVYSAPCSNFQLRFDVSDTLYAVAFNSTDTNARTRTRRWRNVRSEYATIVDSVSDTLAYTVTATESLFIDTVTVMLRDSVYASDTVVTTVCSLFVTPDHAPQIDSIRVFAPSNDSTATPETVNDTTRYGAPAGDSACFFVFATQLDTIDTLNYRWYLQRSTQPDSLLSRTDSLWRVATDSTWLKVQVHDTINAMDSLFLLFHTTQ